jgi:hypothetical protein
MPLPIFIVLLSMILIATNPLMIKDLDASNYEIDNRTSFGGLSAESTDIAEANSTDLVRNGTRDNTIFGGLSAESTDIAEANNKTDLINGTSKNNDTDFGGLSARSINIPK